MFKRGPRGEWRAEPEILFLECRKWRRPYQGQAEDFSRASCGEAKLDVHLLDRGVDRGFRNDQCGRRAVGNWRLRHGVTRAGFEAIGRYHRNLHKCLAAAGTQTVLVNPSRSGRFAEALGRLAMNDRVDAAMLSRFGLLDDLGATPSQAENSR